MNRRALSVTTLGFVTIFSGAVHADPREDVLEAVTKCAAITDDKARLSCYDAIAPHVREAISVPPATLATPPTPEEQKSWFGFNLDNLFGSAPEQQTTPQQFGQEKTEQTQQQVETAKQELDSITAGVTEYSFNFTHKFIIFLDNGQVWKQLPEDEALAHFAKDPKDNTVTIDRGFVGSYNLRLNGSEKTFKVTRIK